MTEKRYQQWTKYFRLKDTDPDAAEVWKELRPISRWELPADKRTLRQHPELKSIDTEIEHRAGDGLVIGVADGRGYVFRIRHLPGSGASMQLQPSTVEAWHDAMAAVPRSLTYFLSLDSWVNASAVPEFRELRANDEGKVSAMTLDGASYGLGFALSIASCLVGESLPLDTVALARCDPFGTLNPVEDLATKLAALHKVAPRVRKVIVADGQSIPNEDSGAFAPFEFIKLTRLQSALSLCFPDALVEENLCERIEAKDRDKLTEELLHYVLLERQRPNSFGPIHKTASLVQELNGHASESRHRILDFVKAVSLRHDGDEQLAEQCMPTSMQWADSLPRWLKLHVWAEYCQHSYDTGAPTPALLGEMVRSHAEELDARDASFEELRFLGSWWRIAELQGNFRRALREQTQLVEEWLKRRMFSETTRPLCRALSLAGALRDSDAVQCLHRLARRTLTYLDRNDIGRIYVRLAQFRAEVCLGNYDEASHYHRYIVKTERLPTHIRMCADRFALLMPGHDAETDVVNRLNEARNRESEYKVILDLEMALRANMHEAEIEARCTDLVQASAQFKMLLLAAADSDDMKPVTTAHQKARRALDFYPY